MQRIVLMVLYCYDGELMQYRKKLIDDIRPFADVLYIVYNGYINAEGTDFLSQKADFVIQRENTGYDVGAYKDVLAQIPLEKYDELLLMNDTFFGFFFPLSDFFKYIDEKANIDFWGLTKHPRGVWKDGEDFAEHMQSYFLLIKSRMLHSEEFKLFWEALPYPASLDEAIKKFELKFTAYFRGCGFQGDAACCDLQKLGIEEGNNPCWGWAHELIKNQHCPVLKVKAVDFGNFVDAWESIKYVDRYTDYKVDMIREVFDKRCREQLSGFLTDFSFLHELEEFYGTHENVYIYGHGRIAQNMAAFFEYRGWKYEGFLVTDKGKEEEAVKVYREVSLEDQDGIVLALGRRAFGEVYPIVKKDLQPQQIFKLYGGETQTFKEEKRPAKGARL